MTFTKGHKGFRTKESYERMGERRRGVSTGYEKGHTPWNKGKTGIMPEPWNKGKEYTQVLADGNVQWKGEDASYFAKHLWMKYHYGSPTECEHCGVKGKKTGRSWSIHYANISGEYKRDPSDWLRLCAKCHSAFDKGRRVPSMTPKTASL